MQGSLLCSLDIVARTTFRARPSQSLLPRETVQSQHSRVVLDLLFFNLALLDSCFPTSCCPLHSFEDPTIIFTLLPNPGGVDLYATVAWIESEIWETTAIKIER